MKNTLYALLPALMFLVCFFFFPCFAFGQGIKIDLVRFSTGGGQRAETIFSTKKAVGVSDHEATALQLVGSAMLVVDTLQTLDAYRSPIRDEDGGFEGNIIMGRNPSSNTIYLYGGSTLLLYNLGAFFLEGVPREIWLKGWVTVQTGTVASNFKKGWDGF